MNATEMQRAFRAMCPPDADPALTAEQIDECLRHAHVMDADGVFPHEEGWTPTYDRPIGLLRAAINGWELKRANAVGRFDFTTDGQMFRRNQVLDNIEGQIAILRRKLAQSVGTK